MTHQHHHGQNQKLPDSLTSSLAVKMDDHVHFKPNIHLLSNKSHQYSNVNSVLAGHTQTRHHQQHASTFNPPSLFSNTIRNPDSLGHGLNIDEGNTSTGLYGSNHESSSITGSYRSTNTHHQHAPPPQIFSASLSANLLTTADQQHTSYTAHPYEKQPGQTNQPHSSLGSQSNSYNTTLGLSGSLHIGSTGTSHTVQSSANNQFSQASVYSHTSLNYSQSSTPLQYTQSSSGGANQQAQSKYTSSHTTYSQANAATAYQAPSNLLDSQPANTQQPTYVLLQAPSDGESGPPQVFLAMPNQDPQQSPYITLQPVNVDGTELATSGLVQDGVNMPVLANTDLTNTTDKQINNSENNSQVVLSLPTGQGIIPSSSNNNLVTYLQPLQSIGMSNMEQGQVIMASSDLQGNVTIHNVGGLATSSTNKSRIASSGRQPQQVGLSTPRRRLSQDPRSCDQCGRSFKYPSDLKKHLQIHTDIKKFACDDCPRSFRRLHQLNVHRRIHTGEKPYVCNRCGAQFRHDSTLTMHIRTRHDHLKPFTCEGCSKKFGRMSHLRKHQRNVCGRGGARGNTAQCKYCEASFPKKSDLKSHFLECEKKPDRVDKDLLSPTSYVCDTCGKIFSRVYDYKRHQLSHSDEKPYGCPQCGKMFKERSSLNKHVKRMHCADGDGTIPIDDDSIIAGEDDDEDDMSSDERERSDVILAVPQPNDHHVPTANVTAQALAQAGIITSSDGVLSASGQTISATEILNFPEVAEALGINSGAHATVLDSDGNSTMIAITQPGNLETTEVSMDMEQNIIQDSGLTESNDNSAEHYIPSSEPLPITSADGSDVLETNDELHAVYNHENHETTMYNPTGTGVYASSLASAIVFKQEDGTHTTFLKDQPVSDHVKAEQAAAHDLSPEEQQD